MSLTLCVCVWMLCRSGCPRKTAVKAEARVDVAVDADVVVGTQQGTVNFKARSLRLSLTRSLSCYDCCSQTLNASLSCPLWKAVSYGRRRCCCCSCCSCCCCCSSFNCVVASCPGKALPNCSLCCVWRKFCALSLSVGHSHALTLSFFALVAHTHECRHTARSALSRLLFICECK